MERHARNRLRDCAESVHEVGGRTPLPVPCRPPSQLCPGPQPHGHIADAGRLLLVRRNPGAAPRDRRAGGRRERERVPAPSCCCGTRQPRRSSKETREQRWHQRPPHGMAGGPEAGTVVPEAKAFIMPSLSYDNAPLAAIEALSWGAP